MKIDLSGAWELSFRLENSEADWTTIEAQVPGNVELDLVRAGLEEDPFWGENLYAFRKYEFYAWRFERSFFVPDSDAGERLSLRFEGINTYADIYVNDQCVGACDNMLIAHAFDITKAVRRGAENTVRVHIHSAANRARACSYPVGVSGAENADELVWQRKPPHSFGWDIMPRLPSAGLWRGVWLESIPATRIEQAYYATLSASERKATLVFKYRFTTDAPLLDGFSIRVNGEGFSVEQPALFISGEGHITVHSPRLWWPRGYGDANLYTVTMTLLRDGKVVDTRADVIGIRTLSIDHTLAAGDAGEFLIRVNGCPILAKGSNWVPLDAMHSRDAARYERALALFEEAGCNILRCWGGNVYEDTAFFDLCDRLGLLVWQDFAMACSIYPQDGAFAAMLEREAAHVIVKLRNHACLLLWAGDNEVDEFYAGKGYAPSSNRYNALTREVLPRAVRMHDPFRMFLPSSPYIPEGIARYDVPEQHNWGARAYFKDDFYKHTRAHFISECGYHGCPSPASIDRFIPEASRWPFDNRAWDTHNTENLMNVRRGYNRNQLMADQVRIFFGEMPDTLEAFAWLSQVVQAEAKKFFIERTRIHKWRRTGIIWWNMLDGWPQISDAVVDWYFVKKRAFAYIQRVQQPICLMLDELVDWEHAVVLGNDSRTAAQVRYAVRDGDTDDVLLEGEAHSTANENISLGGVRVLAGTQRLLLLEWTVDGKRFGNHYITGYPHFDSARMRHWAEKIDALPCGAAD